MHGARGRRYDLEPHLSEAGDGARQSGPVPEMAATVAAGGSGELPESAKLRGLPWQLAHCTLNAVFAYLTVFGSVFLLFLHELGLPKARIGILLSLMPFCGLLALVFAPVAARLGRRRVFLVCWTARKVAVAGLLLLPWVASRWGHPAGLLYLTAIVAVFAILRALAETAWYPWAQEVVPDHVRGRFSAASTALSTLATCLALLAAGQVLKTGGGLDRFMALIAVGCVFGLAGTAAMVPVPGGRPEPGAPARGAHLANLLRCLRDGNFMFFLAGLGSVTIGTLLYLSFLPLFLKERLGVPAGMVVMLDIALMGGGALSAPAWGWVSDRVGSRPVLMPALVLTLALPVAWLVFPRHTSHLLLGCALLYLAQGVAGNGVLIGGGRLLLNGVIPPPKSTAYTALYYAWMGLVGGAAPLLAGVLLQACGSWQCRCALLTVDGFALLFALAFLLIGAGTFWCGRVRPDDRYRTRDVVRAAAKRLPCPRLMTRPCPGEPRS